MTDPTSEDSTSGFTEYEREAIRVRAEELRAEGRGGAKKAELEQAALDAIAAMPHDDRVIAERVHAVITRVAPQLGIKTWYGFPAYTTGSKVLCFFTSKEKGETRYAVLGFNDDAQLDDGPMWPTSYAIAEWTPAVEGQVEELIRRAVG